MYPSDLLRGTALLTITGICSQILGFLYRIALSRLIGAENMGLFQLIMPVYSLLLSLTAVGLNSAVSTLTAHRLAMNDRAGVKTLTNCCISWFLLAAGGAGIVLALGSDPVSVYILGDARAQLGLILLVPCLLLTGIENLQKHFFYGTGNVRVPALLDLIEQVIRITAVLTLLIVFLPQDPERTIGLIICGMAICEIFSACTLTFFFRRSMRDVSTRREEGLGRRVAGVALPITGAALLNDLLSSADAILIPRLLVAGGLSVSDSMSQYGILFGMTAPLLCLPTAFIGSLGSILAPTLARSLARGQIALARQTISRCQRMSSILLFPLLAWLCAVGPELGASLFREPAAGRFILPMAIGVALNSHRSILACALNGAGHQALSALHCLVSDAVQLLFTIGTVKTCGLAGYISGYLVSSVVTLLLDHHALSKVLGSARSQLLLAFSCAPAAALMGLCAHTLFHLLLEHSIPLVPSLGICALFSTVFYLICLWGCGILPRTSRR